MVQTSIMCCCCQDSHVMLYQLAVYVCMAGSLCTPSKCSCVREGLNMTGAPVCRSQIHLSLGSKDLHLLRCTPCPMRLPNHAKSRAGSMRGRLHACWAEQTQLTGAEQPACQGLTRTSGGGQAAALSCRFPAGWSLCTKPPETM